MEYLSIESCNTDMKKSSSYVNAYIFPSHVEAVGVSYCRHFKTIPELEADIANLEVKLKNGTISDEEYHRQMAELQCQLSSRRQIHKPGTLKSKTRIDNMQSFNRSQKRLKLYLYGNFDIAFCLMATLTYQVKVYDMNVAWEHFQKFRKKFKKKFSKSVWLAVIDTHVDNSIHFHVVFKNARGANHEVLSKLWRSWNGLCVKT